MAKLKEMNRALRPDDWHPAIVAGLAEAEASELAYFAASRALGAPIEAMIPQRDHLTDEITQQKERVDGGKKAGRPQAEIEYEEAKLKTLVTKLGNLDATTSTYRLKLDKHTKDRPPGPSADQMRAWAIETIRRGVEISEFVAAVPALGPKETWAQRGTKLKTEIAITVSDEAIATKAPMPQSEVERLTIAEFTAFAEKGKPFFNRQHHQTHDDFHVHKQFGTPEFTAYMNRDSYIATFKELIAARYAESPLIPLSTEAREAEIARCRRRRLRLERELEATAKLARAAGYMMQGATDFRAIFGVKVEGDPDDLPE